MQCKFLEELLHGSRMHDAKSKFLACYLMRHEKSQLLGKR